MEPKPPGDDIGLILGIIMILLVSVPFITLIYLSIKNAIKNLKRH